MTGGPSYGIAVGAAILALLLFGLAMIERREDQRRRRRDRERQRARRRYT